MDLKINNGDVFDTSLLLNPNFDYNLLMDKKIIICSLVFEQMVIEKKQKQAKIFFDYIVEKKFEIVSYDEEDIEYFEYEDKADFQILDVARKENVTIHTSDKILAARAIAGGIKVEYYKQPQQDNEKKESISKRSIIASISKNLNLKPNQLFLREASLDTLCDRDIRQGDKLTTVNNKIYLVKRLQPLVVVAQKNSKRNSKKN